MPKSPTNIMFRPQAIRILAQKIEVHFIRLSCADEGKSMRLKDVFEDEGVEGDAL